MLLLCPNRDVATGQPVTFQKQEESKSSSEKVAGNINSISGRMFGAVENIPMDLMGEITRATVGWWLCCAEPSTNNLL